MLWGEVGSLLILRIIDTSSTHFDDYLSTELPPIRVFLLLEKSRQVMIEEVGGGSPVFRNIQSREDENSRSKVWATYRTMNDRNLMSASSKGKIPIPHTIPAFGLCFVSLWSSTISYHICSFEGNKLVTKPNRGQHFILVVE